MDLRRIGDFWRLWLPYPLLAIALAQFTLNALVWNSSADRWDCAAFLLDVKALSGGGSLRDIVRPFQFSHPAYVLAGALYGMLLSPLGLSTEASTLLVSLTFGSAIPVAMYHISYNIYSDRRLSLWGAALTGFNPLILWYGNEIMSDVPALTVFLFSAALLTRWRRVGGIGLLALSSLVFGLSLLFRMAYLWALPAILLLLWSNGETVRRKAVSLLVFAAVSLAPTAAYVGYGHTALGADIVFFTGYGPKATPSWDAFASAESWAALVGFTLNNMTSFVTLVTVSWALVAGLRLLHGGRIGPGLLLKVAFPLALMAPVMISSRSLQVWALQYSRYQMIAVPGFILLILYIIHAHGRRIESSRAAYMSLLLLMSVSFAVDITLALNVDYFRYAEVVDFIWSNPTLFGLRVAAAAAIAAVLYVLYGLASTRIDPLAGRVQYLVLLLILYQAAYSLPLLYLNHTRVSHEKAEAIWFAGNTPPDSLIVAGHEYPFDRYYASPREAVFASGPETNKAVRSRVNSCLGRNCSVFLSWNDYTRNSSIVREKAYRLVKVGELDGSLLRNQLENEFHYMNYYLMARSANITFYRLQFA